MPAQCNPSHGCRETFPCRVLIPANLSHTGVKRWADKPIDACLAPLVNALNMARVFTAACCCGHGQREGNITLHDGTSITTPMCVRDN